MEKKMRNFYKNEQTGRSMVEMLGVLAIIGVLSVGGIAGYSKAMAKFKLSKTMDQISMLVANLRTLYSGQRSYSGLSTANAISFGVVPQEMLTAADATTITNAFGGNVLITVESTITQFSITFTGLGKEACVALSTADWGSGSGSGLVSVCTGTGDSAVTAQCGTSSANTLPLALVTAASGCSASSDTNAVTWIYY
jgi:type II secretory pathway pseudopilin PulG